MRKVLIILTVGLICVLLPRITWAAMSPTVTPTMITIQLPTPRAGEPVSVSARLTTDAGVPLAHEMVTFRVGTEDDGKARTDSDGRVAWRIRRALPIGTYQIVAIFNGERDLGPSHADGPLHIGVTTLTLSINPSLAKGSRLAGAIARLTDATNAPVTNAQILFSVDGKLEADLFTDVNGTATLPIQRALAAGTHTIEASFGGLTGLLASHASAPLAVSSARLTIQAGIPTSAVARDPSVDARLTDAAGTPVAGARIIFSVDGTVEGEARTDSAGRASRRIQRTLAAGNHTVVAAFVGRSDLLPARASIALAMTATQLTLQFDPARSQGGQRAPIVAHLTDAAGAPVAKARVVFLVGGAQDGEAFTDNDGTAVWWIKRELPVGTHMVEGVFDGLPQLLAAHASTNVAVAPTTIELRTVLKSARVGQPATVIARLVNAAGTPAKNARIALFINGVRHGEIRTDANGIATRRLADDLPTGAYTIDGDFAGMPGLLPARTSMRMVVEPAVVEVQTVPALAGLRFALDGHTFSSGDDGIARIEVDHVGDYTLEALPWDRDKSGVHAEFDRWADPTFVTRRTIRVPARTRLTAGFNVSYLISQEFVDPAGHPIDPKRISSVALTSSYGTRHFFDVVQPRWLQGIHVVRLKEGLAESPVSYALDSVIVDGANVVNRAQQRFAAGQGQQWQIPLQLFSARFVARDALFGFPIGSAIHLTYPDGQSRMRPLGPGGDVRIDLLARGAYSVRIDAPGIAGPTPAALSRDQEVVLLVLSYLDIAVVGLFLMVIAVGLLFAGQPWLRKLARNPLAPLRRGAHGRRPVLVWLHNIPLRLQQKIVSYKAALQYLVVRSWARRVLAASLAGQPRTLHDGAMPHAAEPPTGYALASSDSWPRARIPRWLLDPALIFACVLVALGAVGGVLARSARPNIQAVATQQARPSNITSANQANKKPVVAATVAPTAIAPRAAPTGVPITPLAAPPKVAPTSLAASTASAQLTFSQNLDRKSNGPDIVRLQQRLRELGYFDYSENTGYFGADTARAVARFQAQRGLASTGTVDRETVAALNRCDADCVDHAPRTEDH